MGLQKPVHNSQILTRHLSQLGSERTNDFFWAKKLYMESKRSLIISFHQADFLASVDIKDTYQHVPMCFAMAPLLYTTKKLYDFLSAPWVFIKVLAPVHALLHSCSITHCEILRHWGLSDNLAFTVQTFRICRWKLLFEYLDLALDTGHKFFFHRRNFWLPQSSPVQNFVWLSTFPRESWIWW